MNKLYTIIKSKKGGKTIFHYFNPALALGVALRNGLPIDKNIVDKIVSMLKNSLHNGYAKWDTQKTYDYDDTIIARSVLELLEIETSKKIKLDFCENGGVYTYLGGLKSKPNNSVDILINLVILDYLIVNNINEKERNNLIDFLKPIDFSKRVSELSKYYLSEGYLIYILSRVADILDIDIENFSKLKLNDIKNKTDLGFLILASNNTNKILISKYQEADDTPLNIFQQPSTKQNFSCLFLDEIVRESADIKIKGLSFDKNIANIYNKIGKKLYTYEDSAENLIELLKKYNLKDEQIVELASGTANLSSYLLEAGYDILGIDISEDMLNIAKEKTKKYPKAKYLVQNIRYLKIVPAQIMYTHNFIDFDNGAVELWSEKLEDSKKIIKAISNNLKKGGYLFINKKEVKKEHESFDLLNKRVICNHKLINIYLYKDAKVVLRIERIKTIMDEAEFKKLANKENLKFIEQTNSWVVFQKI